MPTVKSAKHSRHRAKHEHSLFGGGKLFLDLFASRTLKKDLGYYERVNTNIKPIKNKTLTLVKRKQQGGWGLPYPPTRMANFSEQYRCFQRAQN